MSMVGIHTRQGEPQCSGLSWSDGVKTLGRTRIMSSQGNLMQEGGHMQGAPDDAHEIVPKAGLK